MSSWPAAVGKPPRVDESEAPTVSMRDLAMQGGCIRTQDPSEEQT